MSTTFTANIEIGHAQELSDAFQELPGVHVDTVEIDDQGDQVVKITADSLDDDDTVVVFLGNCSWVHGWIHD